MYCRDLFQKNRVFIANKVLLSLYHYNSKPYACGFETSN